ncbi:MAG: Na+/H+ antiporter NhaC [Kangiellaceae bacterium]
MQQQRLPSIKQILFLSVLIIGVIFLFVQALKLPIQLALLACWFLVIGMGKILGLNYQQMQQGINKGIAQGMDAILILIAVGALIGSWMAGGIVPNIIYLGLSLMNPDLFLVAAFVICAVTSLATGTSFGTAGTAGIAMMGIGAGFGLPSPLVAGAVISGAYLGDKLSPLSDTTVMTASLCQVNMIEHIRSMLYVSVPALIVTALLFLIVGFSFGGDGDIGRADEMMVALAEQYTIAWYMFIPALAVIVLLAKKLPSVPVILFGALLGVLWAWWFEGESFNGAMSTIYNGNQIESSAPFLNTLLSRGGMASMLEVILLVIFALGLGGLMDVTGVLSTISNGLQKWAKDIGKLTASTLFSGFLGNIFGGSAYVSLITASSITGKNYDQLGIDRRVLSRNTEAGGTITTPMVPWSDGGIFMATTLGVSTMAYLPYLWFHFLVIFISLFYGYTNRFCFSSDPSSTKVSHSN